jgi:glyoxylase-like metal-dependent hydrolase (beta-lactamase superfamily II)
MGADEWQRSGAGMNTPAPVYEVFALRYAVRDARRSEHFIGGDPHDGPMPMDYFVWLIRGAGRAVVVDSGFTAEVAARRGRNWLRCPVDALSLLGVAAADVRDVVLTHLHYDHVGNFHKLLPRCFLWVVTTALACPTHAAQLLAFLGSAEGGRFFVPA